MSWANRPLLPYSKTHTIMNTCSSRWGYTLSTCLSVFVSVSVHQSTSTTLQLYPKSMSSACGPAHCVVHFYLCLCFCLSLYISPLPQLPTSSPDPRTQSVAVPSLQHWTTRNPATASTPGAMEGHGKGDREGERGGRY